MKLEGLNKPILTFAGSKIAGFDGKDLSVKSALVAVLELHQPDRTAAGEGIRAYEIGGRLYRTEDSIELTEDEVNFVKKVVNNSSVFIAVVMGQVNDALCGAK